MPETVYHESYGTVTPALLRAIKKNNVSPMDYDMLVAEFGERHDVIRDVILQRSTTGMYREPLVGHGGRFANW